MTDNDPDQAASGPSAASREKSRNDSVGRGVGLALILHVVFHVGLALISIRSVAESALIAHLLPGLAQVIYLIPAAFIAHAKGYGSIAKGIWIVFGVTFLLNAAICGVMLSSGFH